jgi:hypothetical protein
MKVAAAFDQATLVEFPAWMYWLRRCSIALITDEHVGRDGERPS